MPKPTVIWHSDFTNQTYYGYIADHMRAYARATPVADTVRLDFVAFRCTIWDGEKHVMATREAIDAAMAGGASAPVAEPVAVVRDNPEDYGTIIDPLAVLPAGTLLYAGSPVAVDRQRLRDLVDVVWNEATESTAVPDTPWADRMIDRVFAAGSASARVAGAPQAEQFVQAAIDRAPEPLRRLGEYLSRVLDEDQWATAERMLLSACDAAPQASAEPKLPRGWQLALNLAIDAIENAPPMDWPVNWPAILQGLKDLRDVLEQPQADKDGEVEHARRRLQRRCCAPGPCWMALDTAPGRAAS
ncbi:hypothetical protein [Bordetella genomosp. 6]|uniref:Uncharacterized protein n=1 Tax=Bordetella genomosp. 6 TaxID=463024 RepID=A0ABX4FB59_9BORD|nr:hypothetical protein [Bordetella genomosp. 6]OZI75544.1 hypothetical protein CAL23_16645 [Bordetella genomosp. 6]